MNKKLVETVAEILGLDKYRAFSPIWRLHRYKHLYRQKAGKLISEITRRGYGIVEDG